LELTGVKGKRNKRIRHGPAVAGALRLQHPIGVDQLELVDSLFATQFADVKQPLDLDPSDSLKVNCLSIKLGLYRFFADKEPGSCHRVNHLAHRLNSCAVLAGPALIPAAPGLRLMPAALAALAAILSVASRIFRRRSSHDLHFKRTLSTGSLRVWSSNHCLRSPAERVAVT